jgi:capsular exopolysaccharide synthesis family protein
MIGALAGMIYLLARERVSNTFAAPGVTTQYLDVPELGAVPSDEYLRQLAVFSPGNEGGTTLQLAFDKRSSSAESYRAIRSSILYQISELKQARTLVFTSAVPGEGKTTVVSNLGAAMATANKRVLVVDADLRSPRLHELLGVKNRRGLADLLNGDPDLEMYFDPRFILDTSIPGLSILPAGNVGPDTFELLSSGRLESLIKELAGSYDLVLIDSPPVLPYSDARNLGKVADGVVLIVRAEETDRRTVLMARDRILQDHIPLMGTILTDWDVKKSTIDYYRSHRAGAGVQ